MDARTNNDWSASGLMLSVGGRLGAVRAIASFTFEITSSVDALPTFWTIISAAR